VICRLLRKHRFETVFVQRGEPRSPEPVDGLMMKLTDRQFIRCGRCGKRETFIEMVPDYDEIDRWVLFGELPNLSPAPPPNLPRRDRH